ncbi:MAG: hypothetical protein FH748_09020 [Balneolaceae bacterium]|nr:hypothetical protein [Balneolaceae bacterium]
MYEDLADAIESLKNKGYHHTFELVDDIINCKTLNMKFSPQSLEIKESYTHDEGTDPGSESTIYAIESNTGIKGTLIVSYGMYADSSRAKLIDKLLQTSKKTEH